RRRTAVDAPARHGLRPRLPLADGARDVGRERARSRARIGAGQHDPAGRWGVGLGDPRLALGITDERAARQVGRRTGSPDQRLPTVVRHRSRTRARGARRGRDGPAAGRPSERRALASGGDREAKGARMTETKEPVTQGRGYDGVSIPPAGTYELDVVHTVVGFVARHMLSKVRGQFTEFTGTIEVGELPEDSRVDVEIKEGSITTHTEKRDEQLMNGDFLEKEKHPLLTFKSTAVRPTGGTSFELDGDLTIKDITRPVTLAGEFLGWGPDMEGEAMFAASAKTTIDREDW